MDEQDSFEGEIDYNDGIGELLRDKPRYEFSWTKTLLVFVGFMFVISLSVIGVSRVAKAIIVPVPDQETALSFNYEESEHNIGNELDDVEEVVTVAEGVREGMSHVIEKISQQSAKIDVQGAVVVQVAPKNIVSVTPKPIVQSVLKKKVSPHALYRVVIGSFKSEQRARNLVQDLKRKKLSSYVWGVRENGQSIFRVQVGAFGSQKSAKQFESELNQKGYSTYILHK